MQNAIKSAADTALRNQADRESELGKFLENAFINSSVMLMGNAGQDAQVTTMNKFLEYLKKQNAPSNNDLKMALLAGQNLEQLEDRSIAIKAYADLVSILDGKNNDNLLPWIEMFRGIDNAWSRSEKCSSSKEKLFPARVRSQFNSGKDRLVVFLGDMGQSDRVEYAYLRELYTRYNAAGFEIVAVSFDTDRKALEQFLKERSVPWTTIWEEDDQWVPKMGQQYGISAIPASILLDKQGKVVNLEARGLVLGKLLSDLFPEVKTPTTTVTENR